jgi:hypothetical protein
MKKGRKYQNARNIASDIHMYPITRVKIAPMQGLFASTYRE